MKTTKPKRSKAVRRKEATMQNIAVLRGRIDALEQGLAAYNEVVNFLFQEIHDIKFKMRAKE